MLLHAQQGYGNREGGRWRCDSSRCWRDALAAEHVARVVKSESEANGGAISSAGIVTLAAGNGFRANSVSGMGRSTGGAIAVGGQGSTLVAMDGAQFVDNTVTHLSQAAKLPLRLHTCLTIWVQFRLPALGWGAVCVLGWTDL